MPTTEGATSESIANSVAQLGKTMETARDREGVYSALRDGPATLVVENTGSRPGRSWKSKELGISIKGLPRNAGVETAETNITPKVRNLVLRVYKGVNRDRQLAAEHLTRLAESLRGSSDESYLQAAGADEYSWEEATQNWFSGKLDVLIEKIGVESTASVFEQAAEQVQG